MAHPFPTIEIARQARPLKGFYATAQRNERVTCSDPGRSLAGSLPFAFATTSHQQHLSPNTTSTIGRH